MSDETIYLLVRADDIGFCQAANQACIDVFTQGICRSVEIMAPCPWFPQAVKLLQAHRDYDVGVHFTLTSEWENMKWRPVSGAQSVAAEDGYFYRTYRKNDNYPTEITFEQGDWTPADVEKELRPDRADPQTRAVDHSRYHPHGWSGDNPNFQNVVDGLIAGMIWRWTCKPTALSGYAPSVKIARRWIPPKRSRACAKRWQSCSPAAGFTWTTRLTTRRRRAKYIMWATSAWPLIARAWWRRGPMLE
ncbi:MAG: ChbG/HpnK family deacetylase [Caldilineaceae bacterium]